MLQLNMHDIPRMNDQTPSRQQRAVALTFLVCVCLLFLQLFMIYVPTRMSVHVSIHVSMHVNIRMSTYVSIHVPIHMSTHMSAHVSIHIAAHVSTCVYAREYTREYTRVYTRVYIRLYAYLEICLYMTMCLCTMANGDQAQTSPSAVSSRVIA